MNLILEAKDENLEQVNEAVHALLGCDSENPVLNFIDLAVEEIFVNICHYAYGEKSGKVEIKMSYENGLLKLEFIDGGKAFNPLLKPDPDLTLSAEERGIGGLGIFLTKKYMDSVEYRYENNKNILTIEKKMK